MILYVVNAAYPGDKYWDGWDKVLETILRKRSDNAGLGCGERDLNWEYKTKSGAANAAVKLLKCKKKLKGLRVWRELYDTEAHEWVKDK
jgi:hypothetical protein